MTIQFDCPGCSHHYSVPDAAAGRTTTCRSCKQTLTVPSAIPQAILLIPVAVPAAPPQPAPAPAAQPSLPPGFSFTYLPFLSSLKHTQITFSVARQGTLVGVNKQTLTSISGGGGGGSIFSGPNGQVYGQQDPIWIRTAHLTKIDLWIKDASGKESSIRIHHDVPLREGHQVTVIHATRNGEVSRPCLVLNHTAGQGYFLKSSLSLLRPSLAEIVSLFFLLACLLVVCVSTAVVHPAIPVVIAGVSLGLGLGAILHSARRAVIRFEKLCERMVTDLL